MSCRRPGRTTTDGSANLARCLLKLPGPNANWISRLDEIALVPPSEDGAIASPVSMAATNACSSMDVSIGRSEWRINQWLPPRTAQSTPRAAAALRPSPLSGIEGIPCPAAQVATSGSAVTRTGIKSVSTTTLDTCSTIALPSLDLWSGLSASESRCLPKANDLTGMTATVGTGRA